MRRFLRQFRMRHETENTQPVVDRHRDDALARHALAVITILGTVAVREAAAEKINQYGQFPAARLRGRPHVEVQAVLTRAIAAGPVVAAGALHAAGAELICTADVGPVLDGLRFFPAEVADRRRCERDSFETAHAVLRGGGRFERAVGGFDSIGGECRACGEEAENSGLVVSVQVV